jgi:hypothetical protein
MGRKEGRIATIKPPTCCAYFYVLVCTIYPGVHDILVRMDRYWFSR